MSATAPLPAKERYLAQFDQERAHLPGSRLPWLRELREAAAARFAQLGFPTPKDEEWKYTSVAPIEKRAFAPASMVAVEPAVIEIEPFTLGLDGHLLVFVNGRYAPVLSRVNALPRGITVCSLNEALEREPEVLEAYLGQGITADGHAFAALNTALMADGAYLHIGSSVALEQPIHLLYFSTAGDAFAAHPRNLIVAEDNSQATIVESYAGSGESAYFTNAVTQIIAGNNAVIEHHRVQQESLRAFHVGLLYAHQERDSSFVSHGLDLGGALVRNDLHAVLDAEGADCTLNGLYVLAGRQHVDNHTRIDHAKPHGASREYYKGILDGAARGVFNGRVVVHPDAQKTDAHQANRNLLLSADAEVDTKPQLEIYADDVKCSHGATVGQLDSDAVFYLQTRGIPASEARALLTYAFAEDVVERIKLAPLRARVEAILAARLPGGQRLKELA